MTIVEAAQTLTGVAWNLRNGALEQAEDGTPRITPPTMDAVNEVLAAEAYKAKRASEYPSVPDQLDALWKILNGSADGQAESVKGKIQAVKAKYPKPE